MLILGNVNSSVLFNENKIIVSPQIQIKTRKKWGCTRTWLELAHTFECNLQTATHSKPISFPEPSITSSSKTMLTTTTAAYGNDIDTRLFAFWNFNFKTLIKSIIAHDSGAIMWAKPLILFIFPFRQHVTTASFWTNLNHVTDLDSR